MTTSPPSDPKDACGPQTPAQRRDWEAGNFPDSFLGIHCQTRGEYLALCEEADTFFRAINDGRPHE